MGATRGGSMPQSLTGNVIQPMGSNTMFGPFRAGFFRFCGPQGDALGCLVDAPSGRNPKTLGRLIKDLHVVFKTWEQV